jgi:hypothetical protein
MAKRKDGSQIDSLTPDHGKLGIDSIPLRAGGVRQAVGKLSRRVTTLVQTSSQSKVCIRSYNPAKLRDFQPWRFRNSHFGNGSPGTKIHLDAILAGVVQSIIYGGRWWFPPSSGRGESCESRVARGLF